MVASEEDAVVEGGQTSVSMDMGLQSDLSFVARFYMAD